jgi:hypothetical protein
VGVQRRERVGLVTVVLRDQVDGQRHDGHGRVLGQCRQARREQLARVGAPAPDIERVAGHEAGVEQAGEPLVRDLTERGERHAEPVRDVGHQHPLGAGVVDRRDAGPCGRPRGRADPAARRQQLEQVGHLVEVLDAAQAVCLRERLPRRIGAGECTRVGRHQLGASRAATDREEYDGYVATGRAVQGGPQPFGFAHGLQQQCDNPGLVELERIVEIVGGAGHELLA